MTRHSNRNFDIAFLGAESVIRHRLELDVLYWGVLGTNSICESAYRRDQLGEVELLRFSKRASSNGMAHTFLFLDAAGGHALDVTHVEGAKGQWRYDRGRVDAQVGPATALTFPRAFGEQTMYDDGRVFRLPGDLRLFTGGVQPAVHVEDESGALLRFGPVD